MTYLSLFTVGMTRYASGDDDGAIKPFTDALNQTVEPISSLDRSVIHYFRGTAYAFKTNHDYDSSIADYDQAIQLQPDYIDAYVNRGNARLHSGNADQALMDYNQAFQLDPANYLVYVNRGNAYLSKGDFDLAITDFSSAINFARNDDDKGLADLNRATSHMLAGNRELAAADCKEGFRV